MNEVTELAVHLASWQALGGFFGVVALFGFFPSFVLRWVVKLYPPGHVRRRQLLADLYELPRRERWFFVAEQLETVLFEGLPQRIGAMRSKSVTRRPPADLEAGPNGTGRGAIEYPRVDEIDMDRALNVAPVGGRRARRFLRAPATVAASSSTRLVIQVDRLSASSPSTTTRCPPRS